MVDVQIAMSAHGMVLEMDGTVVGKLNSMSLPGITKEEHDVTVHESGGWRQSQEGLADPGTCTVSGFIDPADPGQIQLREASSPGGGMHNFTVRSPPTALLSTDGQEVIISYSFRGWIREYTRDDAAVGGLLSFSAVIRISGEPLENISIGDEGITPGVAPATAPAEMPAETPTVAGDGA
jgi:hypothetical protein